MRLCHLPCSCYHNYALRQTNDWMAEIYGKWVDKDEAAQEERHNIAKAVANAFTEIYKGVLHQPDNHLMRVRSM